MNLLNYSIFTDKKIASFPLLYEFRLHIHFVLAPVPIGEVIFVDLTLIGKFVLGGVFLEDNGRRVFVHFRINIQ